MPKRPPILLISLDATRYDYLVNGDGHFVWPFFRNFAGHAHHFTHAYTPSPWTPPAHASMFTGLAPWEHGVVEGQLWLGNQHMALAGYLGTLGYRTIGISSNPLLGPVTNLNKDFHSFYEVWKNPRRLEKEAQFLRFDDIIFSSAQVQEKVIEILSEQLENASETPTFLFLQLIGPHNPYQPSQQALKKNAGLYPDAVWERVIRYNKDWRYYYADGRNITLQEQNLLRDLYRAELDDMNTTLETLFTLPWFQVAMETGQVIITADHGEMLGEQNHIHHLFNLYDPLIHIPLLWRTPGQANAEIHNEFIQHQHLFPLLRQQLEGRGTLLEEWHTQAPEKVIAQLQEPVEILQGLELVNSTAGDPFRHHQVAIQNRDRKVIWHANGQHEFFDLQNDSLETRNIYPNQTAAFGELERECERISQISKTNQIQIDSQMWKLGYF